MKKGLGSLVSIILCLLMVFALSLTAFAADFTGSGTAADPYKITNAADLDTLSAKVAAGNSFAGKYFIVTADFSANDDFTPIGTKATPFKGVFDGNGKTVSDFFVDCDYAAVFAYLDGAIIKNLTVNGEFNAISYAGAIAAYAVNSTIADCTCAAYVYADDYAGGIVGYIASGIIDGCTKTNRSEARGYNENCGGIAGFSGADITDCVNNGPVSGEKNVGGIAGTSTAAIISCTNSGFIKSGDPNIGGIAGCTEGTIKYCKNTGNIQTSDSDVGNMGGIAGVSYKAAIAECISAGKVTATANYAGGIAGYITEGSVSDCIVAANVSAKNFAGGIFGYSASSAVERCIFTASTSSTAASNDGAIGSVSGGTVKDCYYNSSTETRVLYTGKATNTTGISSDFILDQEKYTALDFNKTWEISSFHASYPLLKNIPFHSLSLVSETKVSCDADGVKKELCSQCKETITTITPAYGHSYTVVSSKTATCTSAGYEDKLCSTCKDAVSTDFPAKGHTDANGDDICDVCNENTKTSTSKNLFQRIADFFNKILQWILNIFK